MSNWEGCRLELSEVSVEATSAILSSFRISKECEMSSTIDLSIAEDKLQLVNNLTWNFHIAHSNRGLRCCNSQFLQRGEGGRWKGEGGSKYISSSITSPFPSPSPSSALVKKEWTPIRYDLFLCSRSVQGRKTKNTWPFYIFHCVAVCLCGVLIRGVVWDPGLYRIQPEKNRPETLFTFWTIVGSDRSTVCANIEGKKKICLLFVISITNHRLTYH